MGFEKRKRSKRVISERLILQSLRGSAASRVLSGVLASLMVLAHAPPLVWADDAAKDSFTPVDNPIFSERGPVAGDGLRTAKSGQTKKWSAPVGNTGAYQQGYSIDVPPGRNGMTPSVALSYSSGAFRSTSPVGTGWTFPVREIRRSTRHGFPKTEERGGEIPRYSDKKGEFESSEGPLVAATDGPLNYGGERYMPLRERSPIRYELYYQLNGTPVWVEYEPSGIRRFYGVYGSRSQRVANELGTHSWQLLHEEDNHGNAIDYYYHARVIDDKNAVQSEPVISEIAWGGNERASIEHMYRIRTEVESQEGDSDMMRGYVAAKHLIKRIIVVGPAPNGTTQVEYWRYQFNHTRSADSGRQLLTSIERQDAGGVVPASGEQRTTFKYSSNQGRVTWSSRGEELIKSNSLNRWYGDFKKQFMMAQAFGKAQSEYANEPNPDLQKFKENIRNSVAQSATKFAMTSPGSTQAAQFVDMNGDGRTDILYHAAGLRSPMTPDDMDLSSSKMGGVYLAIGGDRGPKFPDGALMLPSSYADLDHDGVLDAFAIPGFINIAGQGQDGVLAGQPLGGFCADIAAGCCTDGLSCDPYRDDPRMECSGGRCDDFEFKLDDAVYPASDFNQLWTPGSSANPKFRNNQLDVAALAQTTGLNFAQVLTPEEAQNITPDNSFSLLGKGKWSTVRTIVDATGKPTTVLMGSDCIPAMVAACQRWYGATIIPPVEQCLADPLFWAANEDFCKRFWPNMEPKNMPKDPEASQDYVKVHGSYAFMDYALMGGGFGVGAQVILRNWPIPATNILHAIPYCAVHERDQAMTPDEDVCYRPGTRWFVGLKTLRQTHETWADINGDSVSDLVLLKQYQARASGRPQLTRGQRTIFMPRAYMNRFLRHRSFPLDQELGGLRFTESLQDIFTGGVSDECWQRHGYAPPGTADTVCAGAAGGPMDVNSNALLMDINADGLTDVVAGPAVLMSIAECKPGHSVHINRGYGWGQLPDTRWSTTQSNQNSHPLGLIQNVAPHEGMFGMEPPIMPMCGTSAGAMFQEKFPLGMVSFADVNSDGRMDITIAGRLRQVGDQARSAADFRSYYRIFLNTPTGFVSSNLSLPRVAPLNPPEDAPGYNLSATHDLTGIQTFGLADLPGNFSLLNDKISVFLDHPDKGRIVDVDDDGLVDLVQTGACAPVVETTRWETAKNLISAMGSNNPEAALDALYNLGRCTQPLVYRNTGVIPDLLTNVEASSGASTSVSYMPAASDLSVRQGIVESGRLAPGMIVTSAVEQRVAPGTAPIRFDLRYKDYLWEAGSRETVGFKQVSYRVSSSGNPLQNTVLDYDTRDTVSGIKGFPLRNTLLKSATQDLASTSGQTNIEEVEYALQPMGAGIRIRPLRQVSTQCRQPTAEEKWTEVCVNMVTEFRDFDEFGFPKTAVSAAAEDTLQPGPVRPELPHIWVLFDDASRITTSTQYQHFLDRWILGLPTSEEVRGEGRDESNAIVRNRLLSKVTKGYDVLGRLQSIIDEGLGSTKCNDASSVDRINIESYTRTGLVESSRRNNQRYELTTYDPLQLCIAKQSVRVSQFIEGQSTGVMNILSQESRCDYRFGKADWTRDANGITSTADYDSLGRVIRERGHPIVANLPGPLYKEVSYQDSYPPSITTTQYTADGSANRYWTKTIVDGAGNELTTLRWSSYQDVVRQTWHVYDAFGRRIRSYLPQTINVGEPSTASLSTLASTVTSAYSRQVYDGFDRVVESYATDNAVTKNDYKLRMTVTTLPNNAREVRVYDMRWNLTQLAKSLGASTTSYLYQRDGLGRLVGMIDPDNNTREVVRDASGRTIQVTQPHKVGVTVSPFNICYNNFHDPTLVKAPSGRELRIFRDELGREVKSVSSSTAPGESTIVEWQQYDDAASRSMGRLYRMGDESGITEHGYNNRGYLDRITYRPSESIQDVVSDRPLHDEYRTELTISPYGALQAARFVGQRGATTTQFSQYQYVRDALGRVVNLQSLEGTQWQTLVDGVALDEQDRLTAARLGNGVQAKWTYDAVIGVLRSISYEKGTTLLGLSYPSYDKHRNILREVETRIVGNATQTTSGTSDYTYDAFDQLKSWTRTGGLGSRLETYTYSLGGNIQTAAGDVYAYEDPKASQAVTRITNGTRIRQLQYDADGWLVSDRKTGGTASENDTRTLKYDAAGCLREVSSTLNGKTSYVCGQGGRRTLRITETNGKVERVVQFGSLAEIRPDEGTDGAFVVRMAVAGTSALEDARSLRDGRRLMDRSGYLHKDIRGSVLATSKMDGTAPLLLTSADYDPWGKTIPVGNMKAPVHQFIDHEPDPGLGYYHFGARVYDPTLRRWTGPDPLYMGSPEYEDDVSQLNLYQYASNNPIRKIDIEGTAVAAIPFLVEVAVELDLLVFGAFGAASAAQGARYGGGNAMALENQQVRESIERARAPRVTSTPRTGNSNTVHAKAKTDSAKAEAPKKLAKSTDGKAKESSGSSNTDKAKVGSIPKTPTGKGSVAPKDRDKKRAFSDKEKQEKLNEQEGSCPGCDKKIDPPSSGKGHHIKRHSDGGKTVQENHAVVCEDCHKEIHSGQ